MGFRVLGLGFRESLATIIMGLGFRVYGFGGFGFFGV